MTDLKWLNPPENVAQDGDVLRVTTGAHTDFWRGTFYGFYRDNGHFPHQRVDGDFTAEVSVGGDYRVLYDQAGLMIRLSESHWIKAGIEHTDGKNYFSVVVTNNMSHWSLVEVPGATTDIRIRLTRHAEAIRVQYYNPLEETFVPVRLSMDGSPQMDASQNHFGTTRCRCWGHPQPSKANTASPRNDTPRATRRLGRTIWKRQFGHHVRSQSRI